MIAQERPTLSFNTHYWKICLKGMASAADNPEWLPQQKIIIKNRFKKYLDRLLLFKRKTIKWKKKTFRNCIIIYYIIINNY